MQVVDPDGTVIPGAPKNVPGSPLGVFGIGIWGASPMPLSGHTLNMSLWRSWAVPWVKDDIHESLKTMPPSEAGPIFGAAAQPGLFPRWHGSGFYLTKIPDLIGFKDPNVHRSHRHAPAPRPWRPDALRCDDHI